VLSAALEMGYDIVLLLDSDAVILDQSLSIQDMIARWGFHKNASLALPLDPDLAINYDSWNRIVLNTGVVFARPTPLLRGVLNELQRCPDTVAGCEVWRTKWSYEQRAFSDYYRDRFVAGQDLILIPCDEANGWYGDGQCHGRIITHDWPKAQAIDLFKQSMLHGLMDSLNTELFHTESIYRWQQRIAASPVIDRIN